MFTYNITKFQSTALIEAQIRIVSLDPNFFGPGYHLHWVVKQVESFVNTFGDGLQAASATANGHTIDFPSDSNRAGALLMKQFRHARDVQPIVLLPITIGQQHRAGNEIAIEVDPSTLQLCDFNEHGSSLAKGGPSTHYNPMRGATR